jgi:phosphatidylserine decarboxylase
VVLLAILTSCVATGAILYLFWRHIWFFRNPRRSIPPVGSGILSPADGTVVYVKTVLPGEKVISIKKGREATITDITKEDITQPKILVGIFMSPFNVHYNRAPTAGAVESIRHHPAAGHNLCMARMHYRTVFKRRPLYRNSLHIVQNERTVTRIGASYHGVPASCYVVQIAAKSVSGIESYVNEGDRVDAGQVFGMIRIGSQVDLVMTHLEGMKVRVRPGDRVKAGETIIIE